MTTLRILSMGWGVQTRTMAAMMALDELDRVDHILFADTEHEKQGTYDFIRAWEPWLGEHGLSVVTVRSKRTDAVRAGWGNSVLIPALSVNMATGKRGQLRRQCTHDWKILPVRCFLREELRRRGLKQSPGAVECWMGISYDEWRRMRTSDAKYIINVYPLVARRMTRADCKAWLREHNLPEPPKSACTFCPYTGPASWKERKRRGGPDWQEAVEVDLAIRNKREAQGHLFYVHTARKPLPQAVEIPEDHGASQLEMFEPEQPCDSGQCWT